MMRHSRTAKGNSQIEKWEGYEQKDNLTFFTDALNALNEAKVGNGGLMVIGLVGSRDLPGVTLRQAQTVLRWDLRPSYWSDAFLVAEALQADGDVSDLVTLSASLHPRIAEFPKPENNGVSQGTLRLYADPRLDANIALLAVNMKEGEAERVAEFAANPNLDRIRFNFWEMLGVWQSYLWAFGQRPNPLREGHPIASSSFVEYCFEAIQLDLTPGASERNSAPEHLWNGAKWWTETLNTRKRHVTGFCVLRDKGCTLLPPAD